MIKASARNRMPDSAMGGMLQGFTGAQLAKSLRLKIHRFRLPAFSGWGVVIVPLEIYDMDCRIVTQIVKGQRDPPPSSIFFSGNRSGNSPRAPL
jgi:hypothetical protein